MFNIVAATKDLNATFIFISEVPYWIGFSALSGYDNNVMKSKNWSSHSQTLSELIIMEDFGLEISHFGLFLFIIIWLWQLQGDE